MLVNDTDTLRDGTTFDEFHRDSISQFTGMQKTTKGSNFDNLVKFLDMVSFTTRQNHDEMWRAKDIDYMHGLELDDKGDEFGLERGSMDDDVYRFLLKSRMLARNSRGTLNDLLNITAHLLGCDTKDIYMTTDRQWVNGQLQGEPDTVKVVDIPYDKVTNMFVLDRLTDELQRSANAGTKIKFVNFSVPLSVMAYVGFDLRFIEYFDI